MAIFISGGQVVSSAEPMSSPWTWDGPDGHPFADFFRSAGYHQLYCGQPHVFTVTSKLAELQSMLPLKTYRRTSGGRIEDSTSPLGRLVANPSRRMPSYTWRQCVNSMYQVYGEAICLKIRDRRGDLTELAPLHPSRMRYGPPEGSELRADSAGLATGREIDSGHFWWYRFDNGREIHIWRRELFIWQTFNPSSSSRGLSNLEPLRDDLENAKAAQAAMEALWKQGGKPSFVLTTPGNFGNSPRAVQRLADQWQKAHGGVARWHKPLILEEGLTPHPLAVDDSLQYLDVRKVTRNEVAQVYKLNPAAIGDLERATFNNITEILRDVGRSTLPPILESFESAFHFDVVDGSHDTGELPEFSRLQYVEHNLDGIMRGDYEARMEAHVSAVSNGILSPAEVREMENRPFIEDSEHLLVNSAIVSLRSAVGDIDSNPRALAEMVQKLYLGTPNKAVISSEEARAVLNRAGAELSGSTPDLTPAHAAPNSALSRDEYAAVMGRSSRLKSLDEIDFDHLVDGLSLEAAQTVAVGLAEVDDVAGLRAWLKELNT